MAVVVVGLEEVSTCFGVVDGGVKDVWVARTLDGMWEMGVFSLVR